MANKIKAEFQDAGGNIYHLHTSADVVFLEDGSTLESKLETLVDSSDGDISATKISTVDTVSTGFPVPAAGESTKTFAGKVKKFFQDFVALKDTLLTLSKLVNNGQTTATGFALDARYGKTLYDLYAQLNSNLTDTNATIAKYNIKYHYRGVIGASTILNNVSDLIALGFYGGDLSLNGSHVPPDTYNNNSYGTVHWILGTGDIAYLQFIRDRDASIITRSISRSESFDTGWIVH